MDPATLSLIGSVGSSLVGGLFGSSSAKKANKAAAAEAAANREFQERMARNAHTYEAADLEQAGLNRILSLGNGASTPGGAMAAVVSEAGDAAKMSSSALEAARTAAELNNIKADTELKKTSSLSNVQSAKKSAAETAYTNTLTTNIGKWTPFNDRISKGGQNVLNRYDNVKAAVKSSAHQQATDPIASKLPAGWLLKQMGFGQSSAAGASR